MVLLPQQIRGVVVASMVGRFPAPGVLHSVECPLLCSETGTKVSAALQGMDV